MRTDTKRHNDSDNSFFENFVQDVWLPSRQKSKVSWETELRIAKRHILPVFKNWKLKDIQDSQIKSWLLENKKNGYSPATCNRWLMILRTIFNLAVERGLLAKAPTADVPADAIEKKNLEQPANAKVERLIAYLRNSEDAKSAALLLIMLTGAEKKAILKARWENLNLNEGYLLMKTAREDIMRRVWLSAEAVDVLKKLPHANSPWIFPSTDLDKPLCDIFRHWNATRKEFGLDDLRICDLGTIYARWRVRHGESMPVMRQVQGEQAFRILRRDSLVEAGEAAENVHA